MDGDFGLDGDFGVVENGLAAKLGDVQIYCTRKYTNCLQYNGFANARSNPQEIVFLKANLNLN
jgi:hypothetical protein